MITQHVTIINRLGLHARAAARFVQTAAAFPCEIAVTKAGNKVNGKSIMGLMMLAAGRGEVIKVTTEGTDAEAAMADLEALVSGGFGDSD